jgi:hypothetical protein
MIGCDTRRDFPVTSFVTSRTACGVPPVWLKPTSSTVQSTQST